MTRLTIFLFFFTLSAMAQVAKESIEKTNSITQIATAFRACHSIVENTPPLIMLEDENISDNHKFLDEWENRADEIETIYILRNDIVTALYGSRAINGLIYVTTKVAKQKADSLAMSRWTRRKLKKYQKYQKYWNILGWYNYMNSFITITGKVTDKEGKPLANIRVYNKDRNTETYTDSLGNYTIQARRWEAIQPENIEDCYLVVKEAKEQSYNFVQHPPIESRNSDPRASTPSISLKTPCDKLFVLNGIPIEKKEEFLKKIRRKKIEEIIEIDGQSGVPLYGVEGVYGVIIVNTKK
ncbi:carboxypeptidase regulatory-like domain-containing protein [Capnocytophaga genosp. AHN8471]|uniref:Carboxypeptidase regulatory-like domain-containing protein n=1 Tax=Capnocytophaga genosp. AHN8471 TaxID=327574 RepID=A0ABS1YSR2_9FLAO|nr:carboxypeptidase regulatory-like domain-containing protein [Capnocytophaga genosp. AHN8471]MBM0649436.1 carboxypeptidase regulatory-like domain-containing protein [Capnocytophaga genosp. AHN8471]MBM0661218.1 carboxypeptidase regulatory-like domain-containing protein [Capnocytophaga genosp. AHN8471]